MADLTNGIYVYESTTRPNIVWARIDRLGLSQKVPARKLDLVADTGLQGSLVGDITDRFIKAPTMQFLPAR